MTTAVFIFIIFLLIGYTGYKSASHINKVEDDFHKMQELKVQAEAADVAKSQVLLIYFPRFEILYYVALIFGRLTCIFLVAKHSSWLLFHMK